MLKIFETDKDTFHAKSNSHDSSAVLIADPGQFISNFFLKSFNKFSILPISQNLVSLINEKNLHKYKLENDLKESLVKAMTRPRYNNLDKIFEKGLDALTNGNDVYATPNGAILFIEWLYNRKIKIENCECDILTDEMGEIYSSLKNETFHPIAMERLIKLFMLFYNKKLQKNDIQKISEFQKKLILLEEGENKQETFSSITKDEVVLVRELIQEVQEDETEIPSINIFNKCIEELLSLENKIDSDKIEILEDSFVKIKTNQDLADEFFDMYLQVLY